MHGSVQNKEKNWNKLALGGMYLKIYQFAEKMVKKDQYIVSYCTHEKIKFEGFPENGC